MAAKVTTSVPLHGDLLNSVEWASHSWVHLRSKGPANCQLELTGDMLFSVVATPLRPEQLLDVIWCLKPLCYAGFNQEIALRIYID